MWRFALWTQSLNADFLVRILFLDRQSTAVIAPVVGPREMETVAANHRRGGREQSFRESPIADRDHSPRSGRALLRAKRKPCALARMNPRNEIFDLGKDTR
ncbi:MAG: hypothetical protein J2P54_24185, partial [Bradyrhizobiaceae bacterium]|nr:hypothetical protein [Bradyrhizobiaceae bacterium]